MQNNEQLLQLYRQHSLSKRTKLESLIKQNLGNGKVVSVSYEELTGDSLKDMSEEKKSADEFSSWLNEGKNDDTFLYYYTALLERIDYVLRSPNAEKDDEINEGIEQPKKRRYVPEVTVPSQAERAKYQLFIEPARPRKKRGRGLLALLVLVLLGGGGYFAYPHVSHLVNEKSSADTANSEVPVQESEPIVEEPQETFVWLASKNVDLFNKPDSKTVAYVGDIGDRYKLIKESDEYVELDLNGASVFASNDDVTKNWESSNLADQQLISWIDSNLNLSWLSNTKPIEFFAMNEAALTQTVGSPNGEESDALNRYTFYNGGFFTIQNDQVHAIDWMNTGLVRTDLSSLGEPSLKTEDALVYESNKYSLRLFEGENGQTRIRLTEQQ